MMNNDEPRWLANEDETITAGRRLAEQLTPGLVIYLEGPLGAGKTTLTRGILNQLGHSGTVKSPTYTLVEPYQQLSPIVYHFDLYRLGDAEELEYIGIRDYFTEQSICLVEWPERGAGFLPQADIRLELQPAKNSEGKVGRTLLIAAESSRGENSLVTA